MARRGDPALTPRHGGLVLLHSPLEEPGEFRGVRDELLRRGAHADLAEITDDDGPPYAARYIARAALEIRRHAPPEPVVLVARGAAAPLLPQIGAAQRAAHRPVAGYLIVDSLLPQPGSRSRNDLRATQLAEHDPGQEAQTAQGAWEERIGRQARMRPPEFYTEQLPMASDWPDAPCGYILTDDGPPPCARLARLRGWPVLDRTGSGTRTGAEGAPALAEDLLELARGL